jgi:hypothetical protein
MVDKSSPVQKWQSRPQVQIEELLKAKSVLTLLNQKLEEGAADIDLIEYSIATKMLEQKISVLTALNVSVEGDGDEKVPSRHHRHQQVYVHGQGQA